MDRRRPGSSDASAFAARLGVTVPLEAGQWRKSAHGAVRVVAVDGDDVWIGDPMLARLPSMPLHYTRARVIVEAWPVCDPPPEA